MWLFRDRSLQSNGRTRTSSSSSGGFSSADRVSIGHELSGTPGIIPPGQSRPILHGNVRSASDTRLRPHFTLNYLQRLYSQLEEIDITNDKNAEHFVELLRHTSEVIIWGERNNESFFGSFCERNILQYLVILLSQNPSRSIVLQLLQCVSILIQNTHRPTSLYYIFSNHCINTLISSPLNFNDEEIVARYISFLKRLSLILNSETIHFFYNEATSGFPLYTEAVKLLRSSDTMVSTNVRQLMLNIFRLEDSNVRRFVIERCSIFTSIACILRDSWFFLAKQIMQCSQKSSNYDSIDCSLLEIEDLVLFIQDIYNIQAPAISEILTDRLFRYSLFPILIRSLFSASMTIHSNEEINEIKSKEEGLVIKLVPIEPDNKKCENIGNMGFLLYKDGAEIIESINNSVLDPLLCLFLLNQLISHIKHKELIRPILSVLFLPTLPSVMVEFLKLPPPPTPLAFEAMGDPVRCTKNPDIYLPIEPSHGPIPPFTLPITSDTSNFNAYTTRVSTELAGSLCFLIDLFDNLGKQECNLVQDVGTSYGVSVDNPIQSVIFNYVFDSSDSPKYSDSRLILLSSIVWHTIKSPCVTKAFLMHTSILPSTASSRDSEYQINGSSEIMNTEAMSANVLNKTQFKRKKSEDFQKNSAMTKTSTFAEVLFLFIEAHAETNYLRTVAVRVACRIILDVSMHLFVKMNSKACRLIRLCLKRVFIKYSRALERIASQPNSKICNIFMEEWEAHKAIPISIDTVSHCPYIFYKGQDSSLVPDQWSFVSNHTYVRVVIQQWLLLRRLLKDLGHFGSLDMPELKEGFNSDGPWICPSTEPNLVEAGLFSELSPTIEGSTVFLSNVDVIRCFLVQNEKSHVRYMVKDPFRLLLVEPSSSSLSSGKATTICPLVFVECKRDLEDATILQLQMRCRLCPGEAQNGFIYEFSPASDTQLYSCSPISPISSITWTMLLDFKDEQRCSLALNYIKTSRDKAVKMTNTELRCIVQKVLLDPIESDVNL